ILEKFLFQTLADETSNHKNTRRMADLDGCGAVGHHGNITGPRPCWSDTDRCRIHAPCGWGYHLAGSFYVARLSGGRQTLVASKRPACSGVLRWLPGLMILWSDQRRCRDWHAGLTRLLSGDSWFFGLACRGLASLRLLGRCHL